MKSQFQTLTFLSQFTPASEIDRDMIVAFLEKRYQITPKTRIFALESTFLPIDAQSFIKWYESGYTALEIAKYDNSLIMLGACNQETATIIGLMQENAITPSSQTIPVSTLTKSTETDAIKFLRCLKESSLQPNPTTLTLEAKHIPAPNEKVLFHSYDFATKGVGVIRGVDPSSNAVELYCYFIYPTKKAKSKLGYSMHEADVVNLHEYIFEPLLEADNRFSSDDGVSAYRRMKRELEKKKKVWRDKVRRIEPETMRLEKGETYWYINDKLAVVTEKEKGTPTSQMRYNCGNYFVDDKSAYIMLGKINELIRDYLASSKWPKLAE